MGGDDSAGKGSVPMNLEQQRAIAIASARLRMSQGDFAAIKSDGNVQPPQQPVSPGLETVSQTVGTQVLPYMATGHGTDVAGEIAQAPYNLGAKVNDKLAGWGVKPEIAAGAGTAANFAMNAIPLAIGGGAGPSLSSIGSKRIAMADAIKNSKKPLTDTMNAVRDAGYVMPPSMTNPTLTNRILESFGGKAATGQEASLRNADVTANLVRKELGLPAGAPITEESLAALRLQRAEPYRQVAGLEGLPATRTGTSYDTSGASSAVMSKTPLTPAEALKELNQARIDAKDYWKEYQRQGSVAARDKYATARDRATQLEGEIERTATLQGRPELAAELRGARTEIAKIHDVERAMNAERGEVSARDLAKAMDRGVPLTGGLETAGRMGSAFPKAVQAPEQIGSPAVNNLVAGLSGAGGAGIGAALGGGAGGMMGAAIGSIGVPLAQSGMRSLLLSKPYQKFMGTPNYDASAFAKLLSKTPGNANQAAYTMYMADVLRNQE